MVRDSNNLETEMFIKETMKMEIHTASENIIGKMDRVIKEILSRDWEKVVGFGKDLMVIVLKDNSLKTKRMVKVNSNGQMETYIRVSSLMIFDKAKAKWHGIIRLHTKVNGKMDCQTG